MPMFWNKKPKDTSKPVEPSASANPKNEGLAIITDGLLGADEWKKSKIGYITGLSAFGKVATSVTDGFASSVGRTAALYRLVRLNDDLPSLPDVDAEQYDGRERFNDSMKLHRRKATEVERAKINTRRSTYFYGSITIALLIYFCLDYSMKTHMSGPTLVLHLAPIPMALAFTFKAAFYNWIFRNERLEHPSVFLKSRDWLPKA